MISMNTGMPLQPLNKVASGGELSRLMLGLKVLFAKLQGTKLIILMKLMLSKWSCSFEYWSKMSKLAKIFKCLRYSFTKRGSQVNITI